MGVALDDRADGPALVKFLDAREKQELVQQREEKEAREAAKEAKRLEKAKAEEAKRKEQEAQAQIKPEDLFKGVPDVAEWDAEGIPATLKDGTPVSKSQKKSISSSLSSTRSFTTRFTESKDN